MLDPAGHPVRDAAAAVVKAARPLPEIGFRASDQGEIVFTLPSGPAVLAIFGPGDIRQEIHIEVPSEGTLHKTVVLPRR